MTDVRTPALTELHASTYADRRDAMATGDGRPTEVIDRGRVSRQLRQGIAAMMATGRGTPCEHIRDSADVYMDLARPGRWFCGHCIDAVPADDERPCDGCGTREGVGCLAVRTGPIIVITAACASCRTD